MLSEDQRHHDMMEVVGIPRPPRVQAEARLQPCHGVKGRLAREHKSVQAMERCAGEVKKGW